MTQRYIRQLDLIDISKLDTDIHVIGAGGIGSFTALLLAKMGCPKVIVYDEDIVEEHNVASQFFKVEDLGKKKVEALKQNIYEMTGSEIITLPNEEEENIQKGIIILAIDSMEERIRLSEIYKDRKIFIIDGRMGGLQLEIYSINAKDYPSTLVAKEDVSQDACTARAICFNCATIASLICNKIRELTTSSIKEESLIYLFESNSLLKKSYEKENTSK